ncbi:hypothetical protein EDD22DRAFT_935428 [Suillus occidentalis]|nr:hypothetical protein EDD22DRAFT_935428 [Suillus occidentalis]
MSSGCGLNFAAVRVLGWSLVCRGRQGGHLHAPPTNMALQHIVTVWLARIAGRYRHDVQTRYPSLQQVVRRGITKPGTQGLASWWILQQTI